MDGDRKGPVDRGELEGDVLNEKVLALVREFIQHDGEGNIGFSLMALAENEKE